MSQSPQRITPLSESDQQSDCATSGRLLRNFSPTNPLDRNIGQRPANWVPFGPFFRQMPSNRIKTCELQCLGIVLGDAFVQELKMEWVMVEDDGGRDPAVQPAGTTIILYPLTMISKRVE